ncbi:hypothetical protein HIM_09427 [Hirsutella minnesotensis 3608]|uniref:Alcohol dehydrogenase-like N-terminal domain-containing protein n=1 Tax=Hirsutella minnesotensis 3608 TaxID=1043627 RepID=A0A0F7ZXR3_9HYPO|nr:hypothetical protein HIM_09427 [Hirsutella minnesotensis 3608]
MKVPRVPLYQQALRQGPNGQPQIVDSADIPILIPGFVLVTTEAVALNPSDYKIMTNFPLPKAFLGADFCGTVVEMADDVAATSSLMIGSLVAGAAFNFLSKHRLASGAFAEYVRAQADLLLLVSQPCQHRYGSNLAAAIKAYTGARTTTGLPASIHKLALRFKGIFRRLLGSNELQAHPTNIMSSKEVLLASLRIGGGSKWKRNRCRLLSTS